MSELMQANATLMVFIPNLAWLDSMQIPVYSNSSTKGFKYVLMVNLGLFGPGIVPMMMMMFSGLNRNVHGKFNITKYITPMLYVVCLYGLNQLTLSMSNKFPLFLSSQPNPSKIFPS